MKSRKKIKDTNGGTHFKYGTKWRAAAFLPEIKGGQEVGGGETPKARGRTARRMQILEALSVG